MKKIKSSTRSVISENVAGYIFLLPSLIGFLLFIIFPIAASLILSFTEWDFLAGFNGIKFVGLGNFQQLLGFKDEWFTKSLTNTLIFSAVTVTLGLSLGLIIAVFINKHVYFSKVYKVVVFVPYISSIVASAVVWMVIFQPSYGPVTNLLASLGVENTPKWFVDVKWAFPTIMAFQIWQTLGYNVMVFISGLKGIPNELYEAAAIDGASEIRKFLNITIPMVSPTTFFLTTMGIIGSFKVFDSINILTKGGPGNSTSVIAYYIYREAFNFYRMGTANAAAWIMFIIIFAITMVQLRQQNKWVNYDI